MSVLTSQRFNALGTYVDVAVGASEIPDVLVGDLRDELAILDRVASCYREDSEVRKLHSSTKDQGEGSQWHRLSPELFGLLSFAFWAAEVTGGLVDPTVGSQLLAYGIYPEVADEALGKQEHGALCGVSGYRSISLDVHTSSAHIPNGVLLDLHSVSKGLWADRCARLLAARYDCDTLVGLGGDIAVSCRRGTHFPVSVPWDGGSVHGRFDPVMDIGAGGMATSSRLWRKFPMPQGLAEGELHHILDPRTGAPSRSDIVTSTVAAPSAAVANVFSLATLVGGSLSLSLLRSSSFPARVITASSEVYAMNGWNLGAAEKVS